MILTQYDKVQLNMHLLKVMEDNLLHISYTVLMSRVVSFIKPLKKVLLTIRSNEMN